MMTNETTSLFVQTITANVPSGLNMINYGAAGFCGFVRLTRAIMKKQKKNEVIKRSRKRKQYTSIL